eukprot:TRINITY_DN9695_c0_g2_i1.p1 TRINITY_DN9695_c0_g2~~TRINITY_DN9695_c0_g2_i1.p1  ORF type:complete len:313 (+),score=52.19 TRINITY_DN9695_c0_g2_i1:3-941(+)
MLGAKGGSGDRSAVDGSVHDATEAAVRFLFRVLEYRGALEDVLRDMAAVGATTTSSAATKVQEWIRLLVAAIEKRASQAAHTDLGALFLLNNVHRVTTAAMAPSAIALIASAPSTPRASSTFLSPPMTPGFASGASTPVSTMTPYGVSAFNASYGGGTGFGNTPGPLGEVIGNGLLQELQQTEKRAQQQFLEASWKKALDALASERRQQLDHKIQKHGADALSKAGKELIKGMFKEFWEEVDSRLKKQRQYCVPDPQLRLQLRRVAADYLCGPYSSALQQYGTLPFSHNPAKYTRCDAATLREMLGLLFEPK